MLIQINSYNANKDTFEVETEDMIIDIPAEVIQLHEFQDDFEEELETPYDIVGKIINLNIDLNKHMRVGF